ncbi:MAG: hypothetical protein ACJAZK_000556 [Psychroserpens sp.]|jgi:hypothetical protein
MAGHGSPDFTTVQAPRQIIGHTAQSSSKTKYNSLRTHRRLINAPDDIFWGYFTRV